MEIGNPVLVLANPGGRGLRVTFGFVPGIERTFRGPRGRRITGSLEHTAPLPPGSSGGPVLDAGGPLLRLNTNRLGHGFSLALPPRPPPPAPPHALAPGDTPPHPPPGAAPAPPHVAGHAARTSARRATCPGPGRPNQTPHPPDTPGNTPGRDELPPRPPGGPPPPCPPPPHPRCRQPQWHARNWSCAGARRPRRPA